MTGEADSSGRRENQPIREIEQPVQAGEEAERRVENESEEARREVARRETRRDKRREARMREERERERERERARRKEELRREASIAEAENQGRDHNLRMNPRSRAQLERRERE